MQYQKDIPEQQFLLNTDRISLSLRFNILQLFGHLKSKLTALRDFNPSSIDVSCSMRCMVSSMSTERIRQYQQCWLSGRHRQPTSNYNHNKWRNSTDMHIPSALTLNGWNEQCCAQVSHPWTWSSNNWCWVLRKFGWWQQQHSAGSPQSKLTRLPTRLQS